MKTQASAQVDPLHRPYTAADTMAIAGIKKGLTKCDSGPLALAVDLGADLTKAKHRTWSEARLQPRSAFSSFSLVRLVDLEGQLRVDLTRSLHRSAMTAFCALWSSSFSANAVRFRP
jgi:hypothetical protein